MVILGSWKNRALTLSLKPNCLTVSLEDGRRSEVYSYDAEGRLWTALRDEISYRRGLNGTVIAKWQTVGDGRDRRWLSDEESAELIDHSQQLMGALRQDIQTQKVQLRDSIPTELDAFLRSASAFGCSRAHEDAQKYHHVYQPVGILPPDQYMAVVLQATLGCSFNTCTFCDFYRNRKFYIQNPGQFRAHAHAVKEYLGEGLSLRRTIFLGDANALVAPMNRLLPLLDIVHETFDVQKLGGIYAFLDGFSGERKTAQDFAQLASRDVRRVYVGLESGHDGLLKFLKKPGISADAIQAVRAMKAGGVAVGVIVLLGAGGKQYARDHVRDTIRVLNEMHLDADDLIYFSELIEHEGIPYTQDAYQSHLHPLTSEERIAQGEVIEENLRFTLEAGTPHISRYDIREFVY